MKQEKKTGERKKWCLLATTSPPDPASPDEARLFRDRPHILLLQPLLVPGHRVMESGRHDRRVQAAIKEIETQMLLGGRRKAVGGLR